MFIYKITILPINKVYIGLDTKPEYKKNRWKEHCRESIKNPRGKLHENMNLYGIDNCQYEVIQNGFNSLGELALAEINFIKQFNSFADGLNSSLGGDGLGKHAFIDMSDEEISAIRDRLGQHFALYNTNRWVGKSQEERKEMLKHCFTPEVIAKRIITQKEYYNSVPGSKEKHSKGWKKWREDNPDKMRENCKKNGLLGAETVSKKVIIEKEDGSIVEFISISEFQRITGQWMCTIKQKSLKGLFHNGYKLKELNGKLI
jgi:hypothetical protein